MIFIHVANGPHLCQRAVAIHYYQVVVLIISRDEGFQFPCIRIFLRKRPSFEEVMSEVKNVLGVKRIRPIIGLFSFKNNVQIH